MSKVIIYQEADGTACVVHPAPGYAIEDVIGKSVPQGSSYQIIEVSKLPKDRYFRSAWRVGQATIDIDIEGAKDVQRNVWRKLRAPKLAALDVEFMQALEDASPTRRNTIKAKKQALRDVTETPLPDDLDGIRNTIPSILLDA